MHDRAAGVEAHQILLELDAGQFMDQRDHMAGLGQCAVLVAAAVRGGPGARQPRIVGDQVELADQQLALGAQPQQIECRFTAQRERALGAALPALDGKRHMGLLHGRGLPQRRMIEAQKVAGLGAQPKAASIHRRIGAQQRVGQRLEGDQVGVGSGMEAAIHSPPPNTSTLENLEAGEWLPWLEQPDLESLMSTET